MEARGYSVASPPTKHYARVTANDDALDHQPASASTCCSCSSHTSIAMALMITMMSTACGLTVANLLGHDAFGQNGSVRQELAAEQAHLQAHQSAPPPHLMVIKSMLTPLSPFAPPSPLPNKPPPSHTASPAMAWTDPPAVLSDALRTVRLHLKSQHPPMPMTLSSHSPAPPPPLPPPYPLPPLPPYPLSPLPPAAPFISPAERIMNRYKRSPFEAPWPSDGTLPDVGLLVHCFDRHEDVERPWRPTLGGGLHGSSDVSASFILYSLHQAPESCAARTFRTCVLTLASDQPNAHLSPCPGAAPRTRPPAPEIETASY